MFRVFRVFGGKKQHRVLISLSTTSRGTNPLTITEFFCVFTFQQGVSSMSFYSAASCLNCRAN